MGYIKFIKKLIVFAFPLVGGLIFFEIKLRSLENSYTVKRQNFENEVENVEVLILGNSHSYYGVDPKFLSLRGFNLANSTQSFFYDRQITMKYLPRMKNLKIVMIPISYFSFYYQMIDIAENWRDFAYQKFWNIRYPKLSCWDSRNYSYLMMYSPERSFKYLMSGFKTKLTDGLEYNGHFRKDTSGNSAELNDAVGRMIQKAHAGMIDLKQEKKNIEELTSLIDTLGKRNIKVILFTTPVAKTYSKFCDSAIIYRNKRILKEIVSNHNCVYKDYFLDKRFGMQDFGNNDHLNFIGAERFTFILNKEFILPLLGNSKGD